MDEKLRILLLEEIEHLEEQNLTIEKEELIAFNNGRIHQCHKILHKIYVYSKDNNSNK